MANWLLVEFETSTRLAGAIERLKELGYRELEAYTPYSTEEVREALGRGPSRLPWLIGLGGGLGLGAAYFLQWYLVAHLYPLDVGGRPPHMPLAYVPITFEMAVLFASFTGFFAVLVAGKLLKLWDPVFEVERFVSASVDRFWLRIDTTDPAFELERLDEALAPFHPQSQSMVQADAEQSSRASH
jgi:hypothetical protein